MWVAGALMVVGMSKRVFTIQILPSCVRMVNFDNVPTFAGFISFGR